MNQRSFAPGNSMSAEGYKYYVLYNGHHVLARVRGLFKGEVFHDKKLRTFLTFVFLHGFAATSPKGL